MTAENVPMPPAAAHAPELLPVVTAMPLPPSTSGKTSFPDMTSGLRAFKFVSPVRLFIASDAPSIAFGTRTACYYYRRPVYQIRLFSVAGFKIGTGFLVNAFHRQFDLAAIIKADDLNFDRIAVFDDIRNLFDTFLSQFRDMNQTIACTEEVDEGAKINSFNNLTIIDMVQFRFCND